MANASQFFLRLITVVCTFIDFFSFNDMLKIDIFLFYADTMGNKGAYIILNGKIMKPEYEVYEAVPHPNGKFFLIIPYNTKTCIFHCFSLISHFS